MTTAEVEAKLVVASDHPATVADELAALTQLDGFSFGMPRERELHDTYFDRPNRRLLSLGVGLRLRRVAGEVILGYKGREHMTAGGGLSREEFEQPWSRDELMSVLGRLRALGVELHNMVPQGREEDPASAMVALGFEVMQDRVTLRRSRALVATHAGVDVLVAEFAIDSVSLDVAGRCVLHFEVEVELKGAGGEGDMDSFVRALRHGWPNALRPWTHSKLATCHAIEVLGREGEIEGLLADGPTLRPDAYDTLDEWLRSPPGGDQNL